MSYFRSVCISLCLSLAVLVAPSRICAQNASATVAGRIFDPNQAVLVDATVSAKNVETGVEKTVQTNGEGIYYFANLDPGTYSLSVSKSGFIMMLKPGIVLHVGDGLSLNFTMKVGNVMETVTVTEGEQLVQTTSAAVSTVIDRQFVANLPLNGRSFNTLLQLTPGVVIAAQPNGGQGSPGQFSIAGQRSDANNFTVDGVSANFGVTPTFGGAGSGTGSAQAFSAGGGTSSLVSVDALQEFRIDTSSFAPEFGRSPGGQVMLTTRSGTNKFHGGVFDYFRNTAMDANNWFNDAHIPPLPRAPEHYNDFGGFFGGPIFKDKTFFFVSYEGARLGQPNSQVLQVPSNYARSQASPTAAPYLNAFPQPNGQPTSPTAYIAPFTASVSNKSTLDAGSIRIDHTFNTRLGIFGRYNDAPSGTTSLDATIPNNPLAVVVNTRTLTLGLDALITDRIANMFRANYSSQDSNSRYSLNSFGGASPISPALLMGNLSPVSSYGSFTLFDASAEYIIGREAANNAKQINIVDDTSWTLGLHEIKFGTDYRKIDLDVRPPQSQVWLQSFTVQDLLATDAANRALGFSANQSYFATNSLSLYAQDTWRTTPRLTMTYGLRWELSPPPSPRGNTTLASWMNVTNPAQISLAPSGTPIWKTGYANFAPRFGVVYSLTDKGDLVAHAGGGIFYDLGVSQAAGLGTSFPNYQFGFTFGVPLPVTDPTPLLPVLSRSAPYPSGTQGYAPNLPVPRSYQWNASIQKSFQEKQVLSLTYLGQAGRNLLRQQALFQPNSNFAGDFLLWDDDAFSNYHALQVQFRRPLASRLQVLLNYSWAHSLDNASNDVVTGLPNNIISSARDYASSDFDVRYSFSAAISFEAPSISHYSVLSWLSRGWALDGVFFARSGFPFNALVQSASPDSGGYASSRPDRVLGQPAFLSGAQCTSTFQSLGVLLAGQTCPGGQGLNPAAFSVPSSPRQGSESRNDLIGFGFTEVDLSVRRKFQIAEGVDFQLRGDAFNVLNHPNFGNPAAIIDFGPAYLLSGTMLNRTLGGLTELFQQGGPRSLQISAKVTF